NGLARQYYWTAAFHDLRAIAERELAVARRSGDPQRLGWPTFWLGQAALHLPDWDAATAHADALVRLGEELGARRVLAQGHELRGIAANVRGDHETACRELEQAVTHFRAIGAGALVYYLGPYCLALIDADRPAGHLAVGREIATRGGGRVELVQVLLAQAELARHRGDPREAAELLRQGQQLAAAWGLPQPDPSGGPAHGKAPAGLSPREVEV